MQWEAEGVLSVELRRPDGDELPSYEPGAHVDLRLPNGLVRSYSLAGDPANRDRYVVGVGLDAASRGGSSFVHGKLRVGDRIDVEPPLNHFPLVEDAEKVVLLAGGIGITPMLCMARRLTERGRPLTFHYAVRSRERAAFLDQLEAMGADLRLHVDAEAGGPFDIAAAVAGHPAGTHFYCCGPGPMMAAFEAAVAEVPDERVHVEYFTPKAIETEGADSAFTVRLARKGLTVEVPAGRSILGALADAGVIVPSSCEDGICGTCETRVLDGVPDHRDSVLTKAEQQSNRTMMVCVSRCKGSGLVLDI
ncbi:PDR/VanB family oxidoreductase [Oceanibacterium hippocampi]